MGKVLFIGAIVLLLISCGFFIAYCLVRKKHDLLLFENLMRDSNFSFDVEASKRKRLSSSKENGFQKIWLCLLARKMSNAETQLLSFARWFSFCSGFALFWSCAPDKPLWGFCIGVLCGVVWAEILRRLFNVVFGAVWHPELRRRFEEKNQV